MCDDERGLEIVYRERERERERVYVQGGEWGRERGEGGGEEVKMVRVRRRGRESVYVCACRG